MLAAPLAAAAPAAALGGDASKARIERLEDEAAIREVHASWLGVSMPASRMRSLDAAVRRITADHAGAPDKIEIAADGRSAAGVSIVPSKRKRRWPSTARWRRWPASRVTGAFCATERRRLTIDYTKTGGAWTIAKFELSRL